MNLTILEKKEKMKKIKSFIYLDNEKMYSISSQLFEGLTEYVVKSDKSGNTESSEQKGLLGSGRLMADIIESESLHTEKKFLHHYSYNLFEDELINEKRVLTIDKNNVESSIQQLADFNFVKITNKVGFNDSKYIVDTINNFNALGEALTFVKHSEELIQLQSNLQSAINSTKDRNQKNKIKNTGNQKNWLVNLAKEAGLYLDPTFIGSLTNIVEYGYNGSFEVQIPFLTNDSYILFSALLNRDLLSESELNIVKKYSRETEKEFTVFGIPTQVQTIKDKTSLYNKAIENMVVDNSSMKEAIMNMVASLTKVESTFSGKLDYEYIIDPIAIYREL